MDAGVTQVVFDRGGNRYHGRVKALAERRAKPGWSSRSVRTTDEEYEYERTDE